MITISDRRKHAHGGFALLEALMSTMIFAAVLAACYGALADLQSSSKVHGSYAKMEADARRCLERVSGELKMAGRSSNPAPGQPDFPYIFIDGKALGTFNPPAGHVPADQHVAPGTPAFGECREIAFLVPKDMDGDGLLTSAATGDIEWSDYVVSYVVVTEPDGINTFERWEGSVCTDVLAKYVERVTFDTIDTDPSIDINEVVITIYVARPSPGGGEWLQSRLSTCVKMRNADGLYKDAPSAI